MTNFDEWLEQYAPVGDEAYQLHYAVTHLETCGIYEVNKNLPQVFIRVGAGEWLRLASENAIDAFRKRVDEYCPHPDMGWEGAEAFDRAMARDD